MSGRRLVRVSELLFEQLDAQLPTERSDDGVPSRLDFLVHEVADAVEQFAVGWDNLLPVGPGTPNIRALIRTGVLVHAYAIFGMEMNDGSIDLVGVTIDETP